jgi:hypothetical protein
MKKKLKKQKELSESQFTELGDLKLAFEDLQK